MGVFRQISGPTSNWIFLCLQCRKAMRRYPESEDGTPWTMSSTLRCPECDDVAYLMNNKFKAPKRTDEEQWKKIELLIQHGFFFQPVRDKERNMEATYPRDLREAKEFVKKYGDQVRNQAKEASENLDRLRDRLDKDSQSSDQT